ncbi:MAG: DUF4350 domain-containing protein [Saprospiraceae bacterium]|nr:DUF4350 domain-containing protein [Saprospiraceae bacterium]MCF8251464.1 DUF4350 domain-containing protein [Saprospiraceae bacterium]MCF8282226.1 DUF4350 domain-containing protein [Bacteroidales bacterium]MCF8313058.1 DUF4350 domain-containing protein [Saprospiraceae bacterium]MCF8441506.1 DUF4350 domain-containing protein [Saprospiraceae bacterium]
MSNKQTPIIVGVVVLILALFFYLSQGMGEGNYSWREHYKPSSKDPYGTYLVRNLLESYYPGQPFKVVEDSLGERLDSGNFVYVGSNFWLDSMELDQLLRFVERGNRAFIACPFVPTSLLDSISRGECLSTYDEDSTYQVPYDIYYADTSANLNFQHPALWDSAGYDYKYLVVRQPEQYEWTYLPENIFCDSQTVFTSLGLLNNAQFNFAKATYGKGEFLLHTTPLAFTNLFVVEKKGLDYASKSFSHLKTGPIYWDERPLDPFGDQAGGGGMGDKQSPLRYILSQPALAWAWYILLGMAVLYLIFRAKRRQRVIPVLEKNTNTSLEFIGTIGRLFFIQNNHRQLAAQKMRLFLIFVRERYHLPTKELNEQFAKSLAIRSDVSEEHITKIVKLNYNINNSGFLSETTLVDFHRLLERFYRECR